MSKIIDLFMLVCLGALFGIGMRWGDWIYKSLCEIFRDFKQRGKD